MQSFSPIFANLRLTLSLAVLVAIWCERMMSRCAFFFGGSAAAPAASFKRSASDGSAPAASFKRSASVGSAPAVSFEATTAGEVRPDEPRANSRIPTTRGAGVALCGVGPVRRVFFGGGVFSCASTARASNVLTWSVMKDASGASRDSIPSKKDHDLVLFVISTCMLRKDRHVPC